MNDWSRLKRRRIGILIVVGWFSAPFIAYFPGGILAGASAIAITLILAVVAYSIFTEICENDPLGRKILNFATATGIGIGLSLFGLLATAILGTFAIQFASDGTLPGFFAFSDGRHFTYFERFLMLIVFSNGLTGAGLEATQRRWSSGDRWILRSRTLPILNKKLVRVSGRLAKTSIYFAASLLLLLGITALSKTTGFLPAFGLDSVRLPFLAVVFATALPAILCSAVAFFVIIPLRIILTFRFLWRLSFRDVLRSSRR